MRSAIFGLTGGDDRAGVVDGPARADGLRVLATGVFEFGIRDLAEPSRRRNGQDVR